MRRAATAIVAVLAAVGLILPAGPVRAAPYTLETSARYDVLPAERRIDVSVEVTFTNTTPDPAGFFSVFDELELAIHDQAAEVAAEDGAGALEVAVERREAATVAVVALRDELRYEDSVELTLRYRLPDGEDPGLRVRESLVTFPVWSFGTSAAVTVALPAGYEVRVDGDPLEKVDDAPGTVLGAAAIGDPARWLALVTAFREPSYTTLSAAVPLAGGTADLQVRAFEDDPAWGARMLDLIERALPLLEERIGLDYPHTGPLIITEAIGGAAPVFETEAEGAEIAVAFDQPDFTALHQVAHVWISPALAESRWLREGLASWAAAGVAGELGVTPPYEPGAEAAAAEQVEGARVPLDDWNGSASPAVDRYAYAASWALVTELDAAAGADALPAVLRRTDAGTGPYVPLGDGDEPPTGEARPLTTRSSLDHLETVAGTDLGARFAEVVFASDDAALLEARSSARAAYRALLDAAGDWGAPEPVDGAMVAWEFEAAEEGIADARAWLTDRDRLLEAMADVGLAAPDRLRDVYRTQGGGPDADAEIAAERAVVDAYADALVEATAERSFLERIGLLGGPDPAQRLQMAHGRFAEGDLREATDAIAEAQQRLAAAETGGLVRLASVAVVVLLVVGLVAVLLRRRRGYTAAR